MSLAFEQLCRKVSSLCHAAFEPAVVALLQPAAFEPLLFRSRKSLRESLTDQRENEAKVGSDWTQGKNLWEMLKKIESVAISLSTNGRQTELENSQS